MKPWQYAAKTVLWLPVGIAINSLVIGHVRVKGRSMQPALNDGVVQANGVRDWILLDKWSILWHHQYHRGDVVVLTAPDDPNEKIVKRLIALEGDVIRTANGQRIVIPQGKCWIEGDNPPLSDGDSNTFGAVPIALIESRAFAIIWPLNQMRWIKPRLPHVDQQVF